MTRHITGAWQMVAIIIIIIIITKMKISCVNISTSDCVSAKGDKNIWFLPLASSLNCTRQMLVDCTFSV